MKEKEEVNEEIVQEEKNENVTNEKSKKKKNKKLVIIIICIVLLLLIAGGVFYIINEKVEKLPPLPKPEITDGARGEFGIDKNINESTIDKYLGRSDSVYRDMRMLEDPAKYENIGGDRFLSGYIKGFEVIPLPYIIPVEGLPDEVGSTYSGTTLFHVEDGKYVANYKESMKILEEIFPKDKVIFLMCGGGGYAGMTKNFLISMGYDENKIYNVGGYWYYKGKNGIEVPKNADGSYNFSNVPYHKINFNELTKATKYQGPKVKVTEVKLNTDKVELEEGTSFKLNAIVLPNEATDKTVKWASDNTTIATVDNEGTVKAVKEGTATIKVVSVDGKKSATCTVTVKKKKVVEKIKIDNLPSEMNEFNSYDLKKVQEEFNNTLYDENGPREGYFNEDYSYTELGKAEYEKYNQKMEDYQNKKTQIINRLMDNKKSFIIVIHTPTCDDGSFQVANTAAKILKEKGYSYFYVDADYEYSTLENSKLDYNNLPGGSIIILKNGSVYSYIDPSVDSLNDESEVRNWLGKYIEL